MDRSTLESRYRRLLRWYPAEHRREHEDEMIGVLLARARPGQSRPGVRDSLDLARGASLIRLRGVSGTPSAARWRDAFAIVGVIAPVLLLGTALRYLVYAVHYVLLVSSAGTVMPGTPPAWWRHAVTPVAEMGLLWLAWSTLAVLALIGAGRIAGRVAFILPVVPVGLGLFGVPYFTWGGVSSDLPVILSVLTGVALRVSPEVRRGRQLLGRGGLVLFPTAAIGLAAATLYPVPFQIEGLGSTRNAKAILLLTVLAGGGLLLRSAAGRRACALLLMPLTCLFYAHEPITVHGTPVRIALFALVVPLIVFTLATGGIRLLEAAPRVVRR